MTVKINHKDLSDQYSGVPFFLKTERKGKTKGMCPYCNTTMTKKVEIGEKFTVYRCWNKDCSEKGVTFALIHDYMFNEYKFSVLCKLCKKPFMRDLCIADDRTIYLYFRCNSKFCERSLEPYVYNLTMGRWELPIPEFKTNTSEYIWNPDRVEAGIEEIHPWKPVSLCEVEKVPLLDLDDNAYQLFLDHHHHKVAVLVDVPNWVRMLERYTGSNIKESLQKTEDFVKRLIIERFDKTAECIVRYFSVPEKDLMWANHLFSERCREKINQEFFHLLEVPKLDHDEVGLSDIDNYLIVNAMMLIGNCDIQGLIIVSSDKDYLPVMLSAKKKGIPACVLGVIIPEIYTRYGIQTEWYVDIASRVGIEE